MYIVLFCSWYFGAIDHEEAEKLLMDTANASGSFLVHESKSSPGSYSLSIRDAQKVSHHKIQKLDGGGYFVTPQFTFASIPELVAHYSKESDGLLKSPCCATKRPQTGGLSTFTDPFSDSKSNLHADELPPVPPESPPPSKENVYLARYSYNARTSEDLSFTKGDKLLIISGTEGNWWMGKSLTTGKEGYIPRNFVVPITSYELEE